jgi:hypothetical protein
MYIKDLTEKIALLYQHLQKSLTASERSKARSELRDLKAQLDNLLLREEI